MYSITEASERASERSGQVESFEDVIKTRGRTFRDIVTSDCGAHRLTTLLISSPINHAHSSAPVGIMRRRRRKHLLILR